LAQKAFAMDPDNLSGINTLAWILATCPDPTLRDATRAVALAKRAVEKSPEGADWNTLGVSYYRAGDWRAAIEALETSMNHEPGVNSAYNCFFLAMAHWQKGEKEQARAWYDKSIAWMEKNSPQNEELVRFRAEAAALLGVAPSRDGKTMETKPESKDLPR
jgi:tetratricopeptide (TPR) repeat protein